MPLISLVVYLVVIGLLIYLIDLLPIDGTIKRIIHIVLIVIVILWLISAFVPLGGPWIGPRPVLR